MSNSTFSLSEDLLARCAERAPIYDRENRFFAEDFEELRQAGYLLMAVPRDLGGYDLPLAEAAREVRHLAYAAPPTALGLNMHLCWTGVAADLLRAGDQSLRWVLEEAAGGEVFAVAHAETGNDVPLLRSTTSAERVEGGYRFTGRKAFTSLTTVWTRLGIHGLDVSSPSHPVVVHGFMPRDAANYRIRETWDVLGMRACRGDDTILEGAFVPDRYIGRVVPAGAAGLDRFVLSFFAWALIGFANVYYGIALRARDVVLKSLKQKTSLGMTRSMAFHPEVQHGVAEMIIELESIEAHIEAVAGEWSSGVDRGETWLPRLFAAKYRAVEGAWKVVDRALDLSGGFGIFKKSELERLFRDARAGRFHPANAALTHEFVAKSALGVGFDEQPRWG